MKKEIKYAKKNLPEKERKELEKLYEIALPERTNSRLNNFHSTIKYLKGNKKIYEGHKNSIRQDSKERDAYRIEKKENFEAISYLKHEAKNLTNGIGGFSDLLLRKYSHHKRSKTKEFLTILNKSSTKMKDLLQIIDIYKRNKNNFNDGKTKFKLEDLAKDYLKINQKNIEENKLKSKTDFNFNKEIYSNKGDVYALWGTLLTNAFSHALEDTEVYQSINVVENNIELIIENETDGKLKRFFGGEGKGIGTKLAKRVVKNLEGKISFDTKQNGSKKYTVKIEIPLQNLVKKE